MLANHGAERAQIRASPRPYHEPAWRSDFLLFMRLSGGAGSATNFYCIDSKLMLFLRLALFSCNSKRGMIAVLLQIIYLENLGEVFTAMKQDANIAGGPGGN